MGRKWSDSDRELVNRVGSRWREAKTRDSKQHHFWDSKWAAEPLEFATTKGSQKGSQEASSKITSHQAVMRAEIETLTEEICNLRKALQAANLERKHMAHELEEAHEVHNILSTRSRKNRKWAEEMDMAQNAAEASLKLREEELAQATKELHEVKRACVDLESKLATYADELADAYKAASKARQEVAAAEQRTSVAEQRIAEAEEARKVQEVMSSQALTKAEEDARQAQQQAAAAEEKVRLARQGLAKAEEAATETEVHFQDAAKSWRTTLEFWKVTSAPFAIRVVDEASLSELARKLLPQLSHTQQFFNGVLSRCYHLQHLVIKSVQSIHNPCLWSQYSRAKAHLREMHRVFGINPKPLQPAFMGLQPLLGDDFEPDTDLNEVVLVHGCSQATAENIVKEGFDIRLAGSSGGSMYGAGLYFAQEPCKASQYTGGGLRQLLVARVALGDCKYLRTKYSGRLPPFRDEAQPSKGRFDALVVNPEESQLHQAHREFVVFDGKLAYPELLITYECP